MTDVVTPDECQSMPMTLPERLKPERIARVVRAMRVAVLSQNAFDDRGAELRHAAGQPGWNPPAV